MTSKLTNKCQALLLTQKQPNNLNATYVRYLKELVRNGTARKGNSLSLKMSKQQILHITKREKLECFYVQITGKIYGHNYQGTKLFPVQKLFFNEDKLPRRDGKVKIS